jgi:predicted PurR-regulated permease PerM
MAATRKPPSRPRRAPEVTVPDGPPIGAWPPVTYWMKAAAGVLVVVGAAWVLLAIGQIVVLLLISVVLSIGLQPAVTWLERRGLSRVVAVTTIVVSGLVVVGAFLAVVLPDVIRSISGLVGAAPGFLRRLEEGSGLVADLNQRFDLADKLRTAATDVPGTALGLISSLTALVFNALTILILTISFTVAMPRMREWFARLMEPHHRAEFTGILEESTERVGSYVLGMLVVSATAGVATFIALAIIGVPYAAALAFFVALADLVPTIGALIGATVAVVVALAHGGLGPGIATGAFFLVYQQVENYLIHPRVMRRAIHMPAAAIIVAVLIGATLLGVVGALLAIPMAAVIKVVFRELYLEDRLERVRARSAVKGGMDG